MLNAARAQRQKRNEAETPSNIIYNEIPGRGRRTDGAQRQSFTGTRQQRAGPGVSTECTRDNG